MLPINLLPPYIYDKQKKVQLAVVWVAGVAALAIGFILWNSTVQHNLETATSEQTEAQNQQTQYNNINSQITAEKNNRAAIQEKQTFVANSKTFNSAWPAVYETMRDVTDRNILLKSLALSQDRKTMNITGFARSEMEIVQWWIHLRNHTDLFDTVFFNLPGHPWVPVAANSTMGSPGGFGAPMSGGGGFGGPMSGGAPTAMGASSMGAGGGPPSSFGPPGGMPGMPRMGGFGGPGGGFGGGGNNDQAVGPTTIEGRPGINFTALAVLKTPLAGSIPVPSWPPGGGGQNGGPGGGFGGSFGPGSMPPGSFGGGMPPGSYGGGGGTQTLTPPGAGRKGGMGTE